MSDRIFSHTTVLLEETVQQLLPRQGGLYVDGTLGGGGHTRRLLELSAPDGRVIAFDQDRRAIEHAKQWGRVYRDRLTLIHDNFTQMSSALADVGIDQADGVVCDLGVSSPQLDEGERGFSYQQDALLDMRMNQEQGITASDLLQEMSQQELARIFREYGEEKWAARIASFIVNARSDRPLTTTGELVNVIKAAIPSAARREGPHPAKRVFQALRIAVNDELGALETLLAQAPSLLKPGGRIAILTFHSLEDRIVKRAFVDLARDCICPPQFPRCVCDHRAQLRIVTRKALLPSDSEIADNPRARSAKLRVAERIEIRK